MSFNKEPKSNRLHIAIFGKMNVGKSSFVNLVSGQDTSIVSDIAGTTTDAVTKVMELLPIGPVVFIDTAGLDDKSNLALQRIEKTERFFDIMDVAVFVVQANCFEKEDKNILKRLFDKTKEKNFSLVIAISKIDLLENNDLEIESFKKNIKDFISENIKIKHEKFNTKIKFEFVEFSSKITDKRDFYIENFKNSLQKILPNDFLEKKSILGDVINENDIVFSIIPVDKEAPKSRIILPQVQVIRDVLDNKAINIVVKESEYEESLKKIKNLKDIKLVICDSQVVDFMVEKTPKEISCTTFSILFARHKTDKECFKKFIEGANFIDKLKDGDKILISEACTHHAIEDDIGTIKIPKWLKKYTGKNLYFEKMSGYDFPKDLQDKKYALIIQCGGCMINRSLVISRSLKASEVNIPITNYGMAISKCKGSETFNRVLKIFK